MINRTFVVPFAAVIFLALTGCSLDKPARSSLRMTMPENVPTQQKSGVSSFSNSACYAVSLTGPGIIGVGQGDCDPAYGKFIGLVKGGDSVEIEVDSGEGYGLVVYYVQSSDGCVDKSGNIGLDYGSDNVYQIASKDGITIEGDTEVHLKAQLPNNSNSIQTLHNFNPAGFSCEKPKGPIIISKRNFRSVLGAKITDNGTHRMHIRIVETGSPANQDPAWAGRLLPIHIIGEEQ